MLDTLNLFIENWYLIAVAISMIIFLVIVIVEFIGYPTEKKKEEIRARLLEYVTKAELELGSRTGQLKLAQVYDYFCKAFPYTKKWFTLDQFKDLVDDVLPTMRDVLKSANIEIPNSTKE